LFNQFRLPDQNFACISISSMRAICSAHVTLLGLITLIIFGEEYVWPYLSFDSVISCIEKELDGSVVEVTWAKPINRGTHRQMKHSSYGGYPHIQIMFPPGIGPATSYHPPYMNVYSGHG